MRTLVGIERSLGRRLLVALALRRSLGRRLVLARRRLLVVLATRCGGGVAVRVVRAAGAEEARHGEVAHLGALHDGQAGRAASSSRKSSSESSVDSRRMDQQVQRAMTSNAG